MKHAFLLALFFALLACAQPAGNEDVIVLDEPSSQLSLNELQAKIQLLYLDYKRASFPDLLDMSVEDVLEHLGPNAATEFPLILVDVRTEKERAVSVVPNAISIDDFRQQCLEDLTCKQSKIVVYCTIGYRSGLVAGELREQGYQAFNLQGGILAWVAHEQVVQQLGAESKQVHTYGKQWSLLPASYEAVYE